MKRLMKCPLRLTALLVCFCAPGVHAALIDIGPGEFNSTNVIDDNLNGNINTNPIYTFSPNAVLYPANANQLPRTGTTFMGPPTSGGDLRITMTFGGGVDVFEVGGWFGNDDPTIYGGIDFVLLAFDRDANFLGSDFVRANYNDLIDQFLGLRSDVALGSAVFYMNWFQRGQDGFVALDDFRIGYETRARAVSEPAALWLLAAGLAGMGMRRVVPRRGGR